MNASNPPDLPTYEEMTARHFREAIAKIATDLRQLADRIDAEVAPAMGGAREPLRFGHAASKVMHEIFWGTANLAVHRLPTLASEADIAAAEARSIESGKES